MSLPKHPGFDESERLNARPPAEPRGNVQVGAHVEVDFIRADQESFKYVAERVRLLKP